MNWPTKTTLAIWIVGLLLLSLIVVTSVKSPMFGAQGDRSNGDLGTPSTLALDALEGLDVTAVHEAGLDPGKVTANIANYRGRQALHLLNDDSQIAKGNPTGGQSLAIVKGSEFKDGTIEVEVVGLPREGAPADTRGFVGVAFRVQDRGARFEAFYLRFTNGRAENQLQRNHAAQYVSEPDFPWFRLRKENPGEYESYVDIEPKAWTKLKIAVLGRKAQLYVNGAPQPCLIVNDLKLGAVRGQVALWNGSDTEAYFSNLRIQ